MKQKRSLLFITYALLKTLIMLALFFGSATAAPQPKTKTPGTWNFLVYIAANNNLFRYGQFNIKEMQHVGSTPHINIFVQLDNFGKRQVTRYKVEKGKSTQVSTRTKGPEALSGTKENLFDFVQDIHTKNPADNLALILWNHGSGAKDPFLWRRLLPYMRENCFQFNKQTKMYDIDRSIVPMRGIAFNDVGHTYLSNPDIKEVLERISKEILDGKKIDLLGADACHMAAVEFGSQVKNAAKYLVGSEEIEPGPGWPYKEILAPFKTRSLTPAEFARTIVTAYGKKYNSMFSDLTQSAIDLKNYGLLEQNIDAVATLLINLLSNESNNGFLNLLRKMRKNPSQTTAFLDVDYIDLPHFYKSLHYNLTHKPNLAQGQHQKNLVEQLKTTLQQGSALLSECIIHNTTGRNAKKAGGLSIYFPTRSLHSSYMKNSMAQTTNWCNFLYTYLRKNKKDFEQMYNNH